MSFDPHAYKISVRRAAFDGETLYEARVQELPEVAEYAETYTEAYELALDTIETAAEAFAEQGHAFPPAEVPVDADYSGRVTLRLPRSLHQSLARLATAEGVSLNQLMVTALGQFHGFRDVQQKAEAGGWQTVPEQRGRRVTATGTQLRVVQEGPVQTSPSQSWVQNG